jgi:hypothetical protein
LNYVGPLLFFWGFTKIFILGSLKFQNLILKATEKFLGGLSVVSAKNVERSPARVAATAFLVALIIGHSVSVVGALASEQDYIIRRIKADVGADVNAQLASIDNASQRANAIKEIQGVASTCLSYSLSGALPSQYSSRLQIRAIDSEMALNGLLRERMVQR